MGAAASSKMTEEKEASMAAAKELLGSKEKCQEVWATVDFNGNGLVSVAEMDKMIGENPDKWDGVFGACIDQNTGKVKQPVLIRAWKRATGKAVSHAHTINEDGSPDGFIHRFEFRVFCRYIILFNDLFDVFDELNGDDRRIDEEEFVAGCAKLFNADDEAELRQAFKNIDSNGGGQILFDEFCHYCISTLNA
eukprot:CAMPEP_0185748282 /NCGR_PEP_ID=MMETSP1174-20130828/6959_1 /TAXON_ID=35687 /ORGANISM="Dictyocha speculum, Strain CCMP1381" /LENGTH=192 /DNA_ID=CAMNT_0028423863 /DNA_START=72 /DNA_END=650 /DNA_ORIENTATION=-